MMGWLIVWLFPVLIATVVQLSASCENVDDSSFMFDHEALVRTFALWLVWPIVLVVKIVKIWIDVIANG